MLLGRFAVAGAQSLLEDARQLAGLRELLRDVCAADQLALDEDLRDRRPARKLRKLLPDRRVGEDVHRGHRRTGLAQRTKSAVRVAAHDELRRALHEEHYGLVVDHVLDAVLDLAHEVPLVLIRSSWIVPSRSGSASASFTSRC